MHHMFGSEQSARLERRMMQWGQSARGFEAVKVVDERLSVRVATTIRSPLGRCVDLAAKPIQGPGYRELVAVPCHPKSFITT